LSYPLHARDVLVTACGRICMYRKRINVSTVLAGQRLGRKDVDEGIWLVSFISCDLAFVDLEQKTLLPLGKVGAAGLMLARFIASDIRIDTISTDAVVSSGWDEKKAADTVERFRRFLEERRDELVALQILYRLPYAQRRLTYEAVDDLKEALKRPPWLLEPVDVWRAYKRLSSEKVRGNPAGTLADIVMLVRYAIGETEALEPLPSVIAGRFNLWLGREEKAGRSYTEEQKAWLTAIRDHLAVNVEIRPEDIVDAPDFSARGGVVRARALFGTRLPALLDELTDALVA